jgi:hypothetical protein
MTRSYISMTEKPKKIGLGLEVKTFKGRSGRAYLVFRTPAGDYHVFSEVSEDESASDCGVKKGSSTEPTWESMWHDLEAT